MSTDNKWAFSLLCGKGILIRIIVFETFFQLHTLDVIETSQIYSLGHKYVLCTFLKVLQIEQNTIWETQANQIFLVQILALKESPNVPLS